MNARLYVQYLSLKISYPEMSIKERVAKETLTNFF